MNKTRGKVVMEMKECEKETRVVKIKLCAVSLARSRSAFACPEPQRSFCPASLTVVSHRPDPGPRLRKLPLTPPHTATARHGIAQSGPFTLCTGSAAPIPTTNSRKCSVSAYVHVAHYLHALWSLYIHPLLVAVSRPSAAWILLVSRSHDQTYLTVTERLKGSPGSVTTMSSPSGTRSETSFSRLPLVCSNSGGGAWKNKGRPSEYASEGRLIWLYRVS